MSATLGPYTLLDRYAVGGAAEIFRAHDRRNGRLVVIKRVRGDLEFEPLAHAAFAREVDLALRMRHRNLIQGLEKGSHQGQDHVILEFVDGQDLAHVLERAAHRRIKVPLSFSLHMVADMLDGLHHAHELRDSAGAPLGLVHRDLSPHNVLVAYDGCIRVADFGSAVFTRQEHAPEQMSGSPGYISPEQARRLPLDRRSDLFSVGCILYRLVCGQPAFSVAGKSDAEVLRIHGQGLIAPLPPDVPDDVRAVVETACAVDPDERYDSAARMRDALRALQRRNDSAIAELGIAGLLRTLFKKEFEETRLPGSPLTF